MRSFFDDDDDDDNDDDDDDDDDDGIDDDDDDGVDEDEDDDDFVISLFVTGFSVLDGPTILKDKTIYYVIAPKVNCKRKIRQLTVEVIRGRRQCLIKS